MRDGCYAGLLAVILLVACGCGVEPIPEPPPVYPPPLADGAMVPAVAAQVKRPAVDPSVPRGLVDVDPAVADPVPDVELPIVGPGRNIVVDQEGNVIGHGPMEAPPDSTDLRALEREESPQTTMEMEAGIFLPGGL